LKIQDNIKKLLQRDFIEIINTGNLSLLIYDDDDDDDDLGVDSNIETLEKKINDAWDKIQDQYMNLSNDTTSKSEYKNRYKIIKLEEKHFCVKNLIDIICRGNLSEDNFKIAIDLLKKNGYLIDIRKDPLEQIDEAVKKLKGLEALIRIKKSEIPANSKKEIIKFTKECMRIKLRHNVNVDPNKCTVVEWFYLIEEIKELELEKKA